MVTLYGCLRTGYGPVTKKQTFLGTKSVSVWEAVRGGTGLGMRLLLGFRGVNASVKCEPIAK